MGAFFWPPYFLLPKAEATKNLELRTNALAKNVLVDENGHAAGVSYIDRKTKREVEVYGRRRGRSILHHHQHFGVLAAHVRTSDRESPPGRA